jgi:hypothetical protein
MNPTNLTPSQEGPSAATVSEIAKDTLGSVANLPTLISLMAWSRHTNAVLALYEECDALTRQLAEREKELAAVRGRDAETFEACKHWIREYNRVEAQLADLQRSNGEAIETLRSLLFAVENADETGYVTDVGFIKDYNAIFEKAHQLTATPPPSAGASGKGRSNL